MRQAFACLEQRFQKLCDAKVLKEKQQAIYQQRLVGNKCKWYNWQ